MRAVEAPADVGLAVVTPYPELATLLYFLFLLSAFFSGGLSSPGDGSMAESGEEGKSHTVGNRVRTVQSVR